MRLMLFFDGRYTREAIAQRRQPADLIRQSRKLVSQIE
jgi:hypothetical protein